MRFSLFFSAMPNDFVSFRDSRTVRESRFDFFYQVFMRWDRGAGSLLAILLLLRVQNIFSILAISLKHPPPLLLLNPRRSSRFNQLPLPCQNGKGIQHARFPYYLKIFFFVPCDKICKGVVLYRQIGHCRIPHHCCRRFSLPFALRETCLSAPPPPPMFVYKVGSRGRVLFPSARSNFPHVFCANKKIRFLSLWFILLPQEEHHSRKYSHSEYASTGSIVISCRFSNLPFLFFSQSKLHALSIIMFKNWRSLYCTWDL